MGQQLTKEQLRDEAIKCGRDPIYFIDKYAKIQHPTRGLIPFKTYQYQKDLIEAYNNHRFNICLKARQLGITTATAAYIAWLVLFRKDKNVLIIATKQETSKQMIRIVKNIFKHLPKWLMLTKVDINNRNSVELANGSRVKAVTTSADAGRSEAVSFLAIDEVAHIKNFDELWTGLYPTVSTGGRVALFSTPNGTGNTFHQMFEQARNNESNFNCRFGTYINPNNPSEVYDDRFMWWVNPDHDMNWFINETKGFSTRKIQQEYLCNFNASGDTFITSDIIEAIQKELKEPIKKIGIDRNIWVWKEPVLGAKYLIACDVSRGDSSDYSAFHVIRLDGNIEQVAEYKGKLTPDILGNELVAISKLYNNAIIAPESNGGWAGQTILKIREAKHPFLHFSSKKKNGFIDMYSANNYQTSDLIPGYIVTSANRMPMLAKLEEYLRMEYIKINSSRLIDELKTFIVTSANRPEAMRGYHDDLVMSLAGAIWVREESYMSISKSTAIVDAMIAGMRISSNKSTVIKDLNPIAGMYDRARIVEHVESEHKIRMGNGDEIDISWLIRNG